jgi:predicted phosphodiesterase
MEMMSRLSRWVRLIRPRFELSSTCTHLQASPIQAKRNMSTTTPKPQATHINTRFLVISDTHSASPEQNPESSKDVSRPPLPKADVLLHCGDLTMIGHLYEYEKTLNLLSDIDADLKLVIAGNHDITLDDVYYRRKGPHMHSQTNPGYSEDLPTKARDMWMGERAASAGVTYLEEGTHSFTLKNGAKLRVGELTIFGLIP